MSNAGEPSENGKGAQPLILSSEHLARGPHPALSEFEFGLMVARSEKIGKEVFYSTTPAGVASLERFREVRNRCLLPAVEGDLADAQAMSAMAARLRMLSGMYDQAARAASSL